jgi:eukaryotic-like serine/threonine-protein kinase
MSVGIDGLVGSVLSQRYQLVRRIGEGGMGTVFEALDRADGHKCALKLLHPEYATDATIVERLYAEVQAASRLSHPNIARYFGFGQAEDGCFYVVMELLDGVPLSRYLGDGRAYEPAQAVPILRGVLAGLGAAHAQGIVHRDLKPENVYLSKSPSGIPVPKLLDFGIAKIMDAAGGAMSKTKTGMLLGTPAYMSPEQIRSAKSVDLRTDLWAAGVVLYELLSGHQPFAAPTEMAKLTAIMTVEPPPIDQRRPQLGMWREFFARALAKDPERRFGSAEEMARAMEAAVEPAAVAAALQSRVSIRPAGSNVPPTQGFDSDVPGIHSDVPGFQQTLPSADGKMASTPPPVRLSGPYTPATPVPAYPPVRRSRYEGRAVATTKESRRHEFHGPVEVVTPGELSRGIPVWLAGLGVAVSFIVGLAVGLLLGRG